MIAPDSKKTAGGFTKSNIQSFEQYDSRLQTLNFRLKEYWTLESISGTNTLVLTHLEQTSGLTDYRIIQLAFTSDTDELRGLRPWTITVDDQIWGTGIERRLFH